MAAAAAWNVKKHFNLPWKWSKWLVVWVVGQTWLLECKSKSCWQGRVNRCSDWNPSREPFIYPQPAGFSALPTQENDVNASKGPFQVTRSFPHRVVTSTPTDIFPLSNHHCVPALMCTAMANGCMLWPSVHSTEKDNK